MKAYTRYLNIILWTTLLAFTSLTKETSADCNQGDNRSELSLDLEYPYADEKGQLYSIQLSNLELHNEDTHKIIELTFKNDDWLLKELKASLETYSDNHTTANATDLEEISKITVTMKSTGSPEESTKCVLNYDQMTIDEEVKTLTLEARDSCIQFNNNSDKCQNLTIKFNWQFIHQGQHNNDSSIHWKFSTMCDQYPACDYHENNKDDPVSIKDPFKRDTPSVRLTYDPRDPDYTAPIERNFFTQLEYTLGSNPVASLHYTDSHGVDNLLGPIASDKATNSEDILELDRSCEDLSSYFGLKSLNCQLQTQVLSDDDSTLLMSDILDNYASSPSSLSERLRLDYTAPNKINDLTNYCTTLTDGKQAFAKWMGNDHLSTTCNSICDCPIQRTVAITTQEEERDKWTISQEPLLVLQKGDTQPHTIPFVISNLHNDSYELNVETVLEYGTTSCSGQTCSYTITNNSEGTEEFTVQLCDSPSPTPDYSDQDPECHSTDVDIDIIEGLTITADDSYTFVPPGPDTLPATINRETVQCSTHEPNPPLPGSPYMYISNIPDELADHISLLHATNNTCRVNFAENSSPVSGKTLTLTAVDPRMGTEVTKEISITITEEEEEGDETIKADTEEEGTPEEEGIPGLGWLTWLGWLIIFSFVAKFGKRYQ